MRCGRNDVRFVEGYVCVVFFIHIEIFDQPFLEEVIEGNGTFLEMLYVK